MFIINSGLNNNVNTKKYKNITCETAPIIIADLDRRMADYDMKLARLEHTAFVNENVKLYNEGIKEWASEAIKWIKEKLSAMWNWVKDLFAKISSWFTNIDKMMGFIDKNKATAEENFGKTVIKYKAYPNMEAKIRTNVMFDDTTLDNKSAAEVIFGTDSMEESESKTFADAYKMANSYKNIRNLQSTLKQDQAKLNKSAKDAQTDLTRVNQYNTGAGKEADNGEATNKNVKAFKNGAALFGVRISAANTYMSIITKHVRVLYALAKKSSVKKESYNFVRGSKSGVLSQF